MNRRIRKPALVTCLCAVLGCLPAAAQDVSDAFMEAYRGYDKAYIDGEHEEAAELAARALELGIAELGPNHEKTAVLEINLGHVLFELRRLEEAEAHLLRAQEMLSSINSETDMNLLTVYRDLAVLRWAQGEFGKARLYYSKTLNVLKTNKGPDDPEIAALLINIASFEANIGEGPNAHNSLIRAQEIIAKSMGERHPAVGEIILQRGAIENRLNKFESAEKYYLDALRIFQEHLPEDDTRILRAHGSLAAVYEALKNDERQKYHGDKLVELIKDEEGEAKPLVMVYPIIPRGINEREGWVLAELDITTDGRATGARVLESFPAGVFDQAVLSAVTKWRFRPRVIDGERVPQHATRVKVDITPDDMRINFGKLE